MSSKSTMVVAIDGPSASGKSTVAREAAKALGFAYVDSGSFYRGLTWMALRKGVEVGNPESVKALAAETKWEFFLRDGHVLFTLDGEEPGAQIRSPPVQERVSDVAAIPEVRSMLVGLLRQTVQFGPIVMEGRDIGTVVFPDTPHKFYLDANPEERARRRFQELAPSGGYANVDTVYDSLRRRDHKDSTRKTAPLQIALGAEVIDSTSLSVEEVVRRVIARVAGAGAQA